MPLRDTSEGCRSKSRGLLLEVAAVCRSRKRLPPAPIRFFERSFPAKIEVLEIRAFDARSRIHSIPRVESQFYRTLIRIWNIESRVKILWQIDLEPQACAKQSIRNMPPDK